MTKKIEVGKVKLSDVFKGYIFPLNLNQFKTWYEHEYQKYVFDKGSDNKKPPKYERGTAAFLVKLWYENSFTPCKQSQKLGKAESEKRGNSWGEKESQITGHISWLLKRGFPVYMNNDNHVELPKPEELII